MSNRKSIAEQFPELMKEWHPDNKISPNTTVISSKKSVKWKCPKYPKHPTYTMPITSRTSKRKQGCVLCYRERRTRNSTGQYN